MTRPTDPREELLAAARALLADPTYGGAPVRRLAAAVQDVILDRRERQRRAYAAEGPEARARRLERARAANRRARARRAPERSPPRKDTL